MYRYYQSVSATDTFSIASHLVKKLVTYLVRLMAELYEISVFRLMTMRTEDYAVSCLTKLSLDKVTQHLLYING
jgi:hypothetical protein